MNIDEQIFFEHHGVKGMHWGVRTAKVRSNIDNRRLNAKLVKQQEMLKKYGAPSKPVKLGKKEAEKILNKSREKNVKDLSTGMSNVTKAGYVAVGAALALLGAKTIRDTIREW